jgi:hypothetical protein
MQNVKVEFRTAGFISVGEKVELFLDDIEYEDGEVASYTLGIYRAGE